MNGSFSLSGSEQSTWRNDECAEQLLGKYFCFFLLENKPLKYLRYPHGSEVVIFLSDNCLIKNCIHGLEMIRKLRKKDAYFPWLLMAT